MEKPSVAVVGAGIGGLTAGALLAQAGFEVIVYEQSLIPGGCASTFRRQDFIFDVGATQVAGLEPGGIHHRIFSRLGIPLPESTPCDPACAVFLPGEQHPIGMWRDPQRWRAERQRQFPGSEPFWLFLEDLFQRSWRFQQRDPILPPRSLFDLWQLFQALRLDTLPTFPFTFATVGDALQGFGLAHDRRLRTFLDLQLKLYSQVNAAETALLYAATALAVSQAPLGLSHLHGSMQVLADRLVESLERDGGKLQLRHRVTQIEAKYPPQIRVTNLRTQESWWQPADHVVANVTVQNLSQLLSLSPQSRYRQRVEGLSPASGAFVVYLGVDRRAIPPDCPPHLQFLSAYESDRSLFVSVSQPHDGRAPAGKATLIASEFTPIDRWQDPHTYAAQKQHYTQRAIDQLGQYFGLSHNILYCEAATPRTFARFTNRHLGMVGGVGMGVGTFGPFGFANRTPWNRVWLVGDSTHPGEGTAGVSFSAWNTVQQILADQS